MKHVEGFSRMASEIEILAETPTRESEAAASEGINFAKSQEEENQRRNDVYTAAAYGDLEKLKRLVEEEGCSVSEPDASGYYALQWSALNNRAAAAQYLLEVITLPLFSATFISLPKAVLV